MDAGRAGPRRRVTPPRWPPNVRRGRCACGIGVCPNREPTCRTPNRKRFIKSCAPRRRTSRHAGRQRLNAPDLSYAAVVRQIDQVTAALTAWDIGRGIGSSSKRPTVRKRTCCFNAVSAAAMAVPINPKAGATEIDYFLRFTEPKAIVVQQGVDSPARELARQQGIRIVEIVPTPAAGAGSFALADPPPTPASTVRLAKPATSLSSCIPPGRRLCRRWCRCRTA